MYILKRSVNATRPITCKTACQLIMHCNNVQEDVNDTHTTKNTDLTKEIIRKDTGLKKKPSRDPKPSVKCFV